VIRRAASLAALSLFVSTIGIAPVAAGDDVFVTVEIVVKAELSEAELAEIAAEENGFVVGPVIESRGVYLLAMVTDVKADKIEEETDKEAEDWAKDVANEDGVVWAEPVWVENAEDTRFHAWPDGDPDEVGELDNDEVFADLALEEAHQTATGSGAVVAILDTGIDFAHPFFSGRLLPGYDLVDDDADASDAGNGVDDDADGAVDEAYGHGTFVAGVVLQVAPDATILPIRVLDADGRAGVPTVVEGIYLAIELGADVINLSFSLPTNDKPDSLKDALKAAKEADIVVTGAAGNQGLDDKVYPASEGSVISVGAIDTADQEEVAQFSSYGKWVLVAAPGVDVVSTVPGGGYAVWAGTSMASPVVAGQLALLLEIDPDAKRKDLEKAVKDSARKMTGNNKAEKGVVDLLESLVQIS